MNLYKKKTFQPDYRNLLSAAHNIEARRMPLYEHSIDVSHMERLLNKEFAGLYDGQGDELREFYRCVCEFFAAAGYDTVSWEFRMGAAMPGSGALGDHTPAAIQTRDDFEHYPWDELPDLFFKKHTRHIEALRDVLPAGMKAVGGVGNGVFECVQDLTGYTGLCYMAVDDRELYEQMFRRVGQALLAVWERFLPQYGDIFCVCRMGDDLGFKTSVLLDPMDIKTLILPEYAKLVRAVHDAHKPFLLHSCGNLFEVFDDILQTGIDAKHSNEDQIAPFPVWVERYGHRIGNFGGIDTDAVCRLSRFDMERYIHDVLGKCAGHGGLAFGTGNSVPSYVPTDKYLDMLDIVRGYRGA